MRLGRCERNTEKKTAERVHYHLTINCDVFPESITMDSLKNVGLKFIRGKKTFQRMKITAKCPLKRHVPPADSLMLMYSYISI